MISGGAVDRTNVELRLSTGWYQSILFCLTRALRRLLNMSMIRKWQLFCFPTIMEVGDTSSHVFEFVALSFGLRAATVQHVHQSRGINIRLVSSLGSIRLFVRHKRLIHPTDRQSVCTLNNSLSIIGKKEQGQAIDCIICLSQELAAPPWKVSEVVSISLRHRCRYAQMV